MEGKYKIGLVGFMFPPAVLKKTMLKITLIP